MAFFTSLASGQVLTGTVNADNFQLSAGSGITILGLEGNDVVRGETAVRANWTMAGGSDTLNLSGDLDSSQVRMGAGGDSVYISGSISGQTVLKMGDGSDTLIADSADNSTIEFGAGADQAIFSSNIESSTLLFGAGADTLIAESSTRSTVAMGGGADVVDLGELISGTEVTLGAGSDRFVVSAFNSSVVQGGGNADTIIADEVSADSVINGGAGADVITVSGLDGSAVIFGDAGNDTISVDVVDSSGVINGGAGFDSITLSGDQSSIVIGGLGGDSIFAGSRVTYTIETATDSNINGFDTIALSAGAQSGRVTMSSVASQNLKVASGLDVAGFFSTDNEGVVTFTSTVATTLAARAQLLSDALGNAESVIFNADGSNYLFIAGSVKTDIVDDVLIDVDAGINSLSANGKAVAFSV